MNKIRGTIKFLTKGCSCKKGCATNSCGCKKKSNHCGPGCECQGCTNLSQVQVPQDEYHNVSDDGDNSDDMTDYDNSSEECEELETEVITDDFLFDSPNIL